MKYFLIKYDRHEGELKELREFGPSERQAALKERFALERANRLNADIEVVLLGAQSIDALYRTHSRYFKTPDELAAAL